MTTSRLDFNWHLECFHHFWKPGKPEAEAQIRRDRRIIGVLAARCRLALQPSNAQTLRTEVLLQCALQRFCRMKQQSFFEFIIVVAAVLKDHE